LLHRVGGASGRAAPDPNPSQSTMPSEVDPVAAELFEGPGEMRSLARAFPWAATPLGPVDEWSPTLRVVVQMILSSGLPQIVLWGRELIQVYNDAYAALIRDKHPAALGRGNLEVWPEVAHLNGPIYERVFAGETVTLEDAHYPLERSGAAEDVYLTVSFSPVREPLGRVVGVLAAMVETTQTVAIRALQAEREQLYRDLEVERARLRKVVRQATAFIATLRGPDHVFEMANPPYLQLVGHREILGRPVREALPEVEEQGFVELLDHVYAAGEPYVGNEVPILLQREPGAEMEEHFVNFVYQPLRDGTGAVEGILAHGVDVTDLVLARREAEETHREQTATAETLQRVGRSVAAELDTERVVQAVTDAATSLTGAQFGAFFYNVRNERGESYALNAISGVPREAVADFPMPRNTPIFAPTFHGERVVRSDDITEDPRYGTRAPHHGMPPDHLPVRSYLAVPVVSRTGEVLGGLFFGHELPGRFEDRHESIAEGIAGWAAVAMDNARLYQAEHQARAEAERANRTKSDFLAIMSHELRTPLNAILGYTDLLLSGIPVEIPDEARQKMTRIGVSARHLLALIEEILTFSRLEAGEERVEVGPIDLPVLLDEVQALSEPLALAKGLDFRCRYPEVPPHLESDERKIRQILVNLLGNAVKFTDEGEVSLAVEEVGSDVLFRVTDTGIGIEPDNLERIFEPFWQVEGGTTRAAGGTGLGLGVARRLARLLGGDVTVDSEPGRGSTFLVRLPSRAPADVRPDARPRPDRAGGGRPS
jgi:signal transduction histidine kinase/PAS domain-containing protein